MNLQETVLIQLRDLILRGEFEPGQRLAEQQLAERLGASRTPVRAALVTLEQEGLVEANETGKFLVRQFTPREVADAIAVRGHLEGMAARLVAEHGVSRQLQLDLQACLDDGDSALAANPLTYESYADYAAMNDRFHALILDACGNRALQRAVALNDKLPFAPASAMLPMQGTVTLDRDWMLYAHRQLDFSQGLGLPCAAAEGFADPRQGQVSRAVHAGIHPQRPTTRRMAGSTRSVSLRRSSAMRMFICATSVCSIASACARAP